MLRFSPRLGAVARIAVLAALCACNGSDPLAANAVAVNGTITGNLSDYGPWIGQKTVTATAMNGALTIIGEDVNFKKITLLLVGVNVNATQQNLPRTISITPATSDTLGYAEFDETYQSGQYQYNTFESGHLTVVLTHLGPDRVTGTFEFSVARWPSGSALPAGSVATRSLTSGVFDIKPTIGNQ